MTRSDFLKNIIGIYGLGALPSNNIKQYEKIFLLQCFVRGFVYYKGIELLPSISSSDPLQLVREPDNKYDKYAIAVYHKQEKIGYLPREKNEIISKILDAGLLDLYAETSHVNTDADTWENIFLVIYALKEVTGTTLPPEAQYLTVQYTPHYYSINVNKKYQSRYYTNNEVIDEENYDIENSLERFRENPDNIAVEEKLAAAIADEDDIEDAILCNKFIVNSQKSPLQIEDLKKIALQVDKELINIDALFDEKGIIVADINKLSPIINSIDSFSEIIDNSGRTFYEIIFKT